MEEPVGEDIEGEEEEPPTNSTTKITKKARDKIIKKLLRKAIE
jgi:hypothetical protein